MNLFTGVRIETSWAPRGVIVLASYCNLEPDVYRTVTLNLKQHVGLELQTEHSHHSSLSLGQCALGAHQPLQTTEPERIGRLFPVLLS